MLPLSIEEASYLAGFFDGEGCVASYFDRGAPRIELSVSHTHLSILTNLSATFGGYISKRPFQSSRHKPCWSWRLRAKDSVLAMGESLLPHLREKRTQMQLAIEYCQLPSGDPRRRVLVAEIRALKRATEEPA